MWKYVAVSKHLHLVFQSDLKCWLRRGKNQTLNTQFIQWFLHSSTAQQVHLHVWMILIWFYMFYCYFFAFSFLFASFWCWRFSPLQSVWYKSGRSYIHFCKHLSTLIKMKEELSINPKQKRIEVNMYACSPIMQ